jgi:branched-chain amino acid transport system permease protein
MSPSWKKWGLYLALGAVLLAIPLIAGHYLTYLVNLAGIYAIAIIGLNILMGLGGQMFFGAVALMALGGYSAAILAVRLGFPFFVSIPVAGFLTCILSLTIALPALRVRGLYLAMISVGFHLILEQIIGGWDSFTGGYNGISLPKASLMGVPFSSDRGFYFVILVSLILCLWSARNLMRMRVGRAIWAVGQDPVAASVLGLNVTRYKIVAFLVCAFYCGISGGLMAHYLRFITPDHFTMVVAIMLLVGMIIGGWGSLGGSIAGGVFVTFLPEGIGFFKDTFLGASTALYDIQSAVSGFIIIGIVMFMPHGFTQWAKDIGSRWSSAKQ